MTAIAKRKRTASAAYRTQAILTVAGDSGSRDMDIERFLEFLRIRQPQVRIRFVGVTGDSRCPIDVVCVTGGDAIVEIAVRSGRTPETRYDLHTGDLRPVQHGALTIALVQLAPDPFSSQTIPPEAYRATLRVTE